MRHSFSLLFNSFVKTRQGIAISLLKKIVNPTGKIKKRKVFHLGINKKNEDTSRHISR